MSEGRDGDDHGGNRGDDRKNKKAEAVMGIGQGVLLDDSEHLAASCTAMFARGASSDCEDAHLRR